MPGIMMDDVSTSGSRRETNTQMANNGISSATPITKNDVGAAELKNKLRYLNGASKGGEAPMSNNEGQVPSRSLSQAPPELVHITQGFFPFAQLVNRAAQQCWNDLIDLITELADVQAPRQPQAPHLTTANGKPAEGQSAENVHKKLRILDFGQAKRVEFIKLLVLLQWSRQAIDVSQLVDLQGFIRTQHQAYYGALQRVGDMKRDLVRAQMANPDLRTALEVLSRGRVANMPNVGEIIPCIPDPY
jgi:mediator of RNA polymerase II transcription subunit 14